MSKTNDKVRTTFRLPKEIDDKITEAAKKIGISKNAYIIIILNKIFKEQTA